MWGLGISFMDLAGLGRFEAQILERGAPGLKSPEIDGEQASTSHHGFFLMAPRTEAWRPKT
jgi:hypothetical protein